MQALTYRYKSGRPPANRAANSTDMAHSSAQFSGDATLDASTSSTVGHARNITAPNISHDTGVNTAAHSVATGPVTKDTQEFGDSETWDVLLDMSAAVDQLSVGCLQRIRDGEDIQDPVLQCVFIKPMGEAAGREPRYRVVWNDSVHYMQSMLPQHISPLVVSEKLRKGMLCRLKQFQMKAVKEKIIMIVLDLDLLEEFGEPSKIGDPIALDPQSEETKTKTDNITGQNFYGAQAQAAPQRQQTKQLPTRTNGSSHALINPIESLSPWSHKWTIKVRCTHKGDIKSWHKSTGEGRLFSANFLDDSGEIRATGFNEAVDQYYDLIQQGSVYYISAPCRVVPAKRQFSTVNNDYELTFEKDTIVEKAEDVDGVPQVKYNFTTLADLQNVEKDTTIDCIAILQSVGEVSEITSKTTSKPYQKRELTLVDNTGFNVRLTVWGASAQSFDAPNESVLAFKGVKVSDFGGRSLSLLSSGTMMINPEIEDCYKLKGWYSAEGQQAEFQSHANTMGTSAATSGGRNQETKTVAQIGEENLGMKPDGDADWFSLKATILFVGRNSFAYPACRSEGCNRKVIEVDQSGWRCEKDDKTWDSPLWRYVLNISVADHTGQLKLNCFDDTGRIIMGMTADEANAIMTEDNGGGKRVDAIFTDATCKTFIFRCKAKMDTYQDQQRVRYQVQTATPLNYSTEASKLADKIKQFSVADEGLFVS